VDAQDRRIDRKRLRLRRQIRRATARLKVGAVAPTYPHPTIAQFTTSSSERYFEDYVPGSIYEFGSITLSEDDIVEFARRYDPQYFHVDRERATHGPFGGLIASGWQTGAVVMRLFVDHYLSHAASLGSPGMDEIRWLRPVRPGDSLRLRVTVLESRVSRSKPDRGIVKASIEAFNQRDELVATMLGSNFIARRPVGS
jgi:acyl dehydratase